MIKKIIELNNKFNNSVEGVVEDLPDQKKALVFAFLFFLCLGAIFNLAFYLGQVNICDNSGGEILEETFTGKKVCLITKKIDACVDSDNNIVVNDEQITHNWSVN